MKRKKRVIVVGTGAGGALMADALQGPFDVTILEAGKDFRPFSLPVDMLASFRSTGLFLDERMIQILFPAMQVRKSEDMIMVNGIGVGGTTTLATGNAVRYEGYFEKIGMDLTREYDFLEKTLPITTEHEKYWNPASRELFARFEKLGLDPRPTPKFLKSPACACCGHCAIGCPHGTKWDTRDLVKSAVEKGARLLTGCRVEKVLVEEGEARAVKAFLGLKPYLFRADLVILAAGGFGTPVILENSGIDCQKTLFVDPVLCLAARREDFRQDSQLLMPFYSKRDGYMLSPYLDYLSFFFDRKWRFPKKDMVSLMVKMADDSAGLSEKRGIHKKLTSGDRERLERGLQDCREILSDMGISEEDTFLGIVNAGHPGGMLPLTEKTAVTVHDPALPGNLYVADGTIMPGSAGLPPILTIMALSLRIAERIREGV